MSNPFRPIISAPPLAVASSSSSSAYSDSGSSTSEFTALDALREAGIVVASDGAEYNKIAEFDPIDATTNPSLVYAAVCTPGSEYAHLLEEAVQYAVESDVGIDERTELAMDYLLVLVGAHILALIPGRVSLSLDPRLFLSPSYDRVLARCLSLHALASAHISSSTHRILLKIPATTLGIRVAATLESTYGIHTNMTLVFGTVQALACAQAGATVISPFVGRVKDWWDTKESETENGTTVPPALSSHPGICLVRRIKHLYTTHGYTPRTQIMAAGFRAVDEIIELGRTGAVDGPDIVTLPPDLLAGLRAREGIPVELEGADRLCHEDDVPTYFTRTPGGFIAEHEGLALFERDLAREEIALDKVPEGLKKFSADAAKLDCVLRETIMVRMRFRSESDKEAARVLNGKPL